MKARLYAVPASHPSACVEAALRVKGLDYRRVDLIPLLHKPRQRLRFGRPTVPGVVLDGERVVGSRAILRRLDELQAQPPLYPPGGPGRERVLEAERWGDEVLQDATRRITYGGLRHHPAALRSYLAGARLALPAWALTLTRGPSIALGARLNGADEETVREDLRSLPGWLELIDEWIAAGVLGGHEANAADLQIGSSLRLLLTLSDLRPLFGERPGARLAQRHFPDFPGEIPAGSLPRRDRRWLE